MNRREEEGIGRGEGLRCLSREKQKERNSMVIHRNSSIEVGNGIPIISEIDTF